MSEFINFEAEEEGEYDSDNESKSDDNDSENDNDGDDNDFLDDKIIPVEEVPPNPYMGIELRLPRDLDRVLNRVSSLIFYVLLYFQKRERSPSSDEDELPEIKRRKVRVNELKRKRSPSPSPGRRFRSPNLGFPPTPPRTPSPAISISQDSDSVIELSDSTESEPDSEEEPKRKKLRICEENNEVKEYTRDESQFKLMHDKNMKSMKRTSDNIKMKYKEFFPIKKLKLDEKLLDHNKWSRNAREHALQRMRDIMNVHLRVNKLKRGHEDPLTPEETALPGVTVDDFPHDPPGFDRVGEDHTDSRESFAGTEI